MSARHKYLLAFGALLMFIPLAVAGRSPLPADHSNNSNTPGKASTPESTSGSKDSQLAPALLRLLVKKGVLTSAEADLLRDTSPGVGLEPLLSLLKQKGLLTDADLVALDSASATAPQVPSLGQVASAHPIVPVGVAPGNGGVASLPASLGKAPIQKEPSPTEKAPLSVRIGDSEFTPGGFAELTTLFRSTNVGSGLTTSFGGIPYAGTAAGGLSETRLSMQNSRFSLAVTSKVDGFDVKGYFEADFLGNAPANMYVTSNSVTPRGRIYWVDLRKGKLEVLGGQGWSLITPNRSGISPMTSDVFYSLNDDASYQLGVTWARQAQVRFVYHASDTIAAAVSVENPQQFVGTATLPSSFPATEVETGAGNNTTPNLAPDMIAKLAWDPKLAGRHQHFEVVGLLTSARVYDPAAKLRSTATGAGLAVNLNLEVLKNLHAILDTYYSDGGGRYILGMGPGFVVRPNSAGWLGPALVHSGSVVAGFEYLVTKATSIQAYYGAAYFGRYVSSFASTDPETKQAVTVPIGYGFTGSPGTQNRSIQEPTLGMVRTFWKNPRLGALQLITQYSYVTRAPWFVEPGKPKNAHVGMAFAGLRYSLP